MLLVEEVMRSGHNAARMRVDIDGLPVSLGHMICLMPNGDMWDTFGGLRVPLPSIAVVWTVRKGMETFLSVDQCTSIRHTRFERTTVRK